MQSIGVADVKAYYEVEIWLFSKREFWTLPKVGGESIAQFLGGPSSSVAAAVVVEDGIAEERGHIYLSLTPVKTLIVVIDTIFVLIDSFESPNKPTARVAFRINEEDEVVCGELQCEKRRKFSNGEDSRLATSTGGLTTEIGLSKVGSLIGQSILTGRVGMLLFSETSLGFELPPREELNAHANFLQQSVYYLNLWAKTLLKDFFDIYPPTVHKLGHTTARVNGDQMIQVTRAVGLEVTSASYVLLEDIWFCLVLVEVVRLTFAVLQGVTLLEGDGHAYWEESRVTVTVFSLLWMVCKPSLAVRSMPIIVKLPSRSQLFRIWLILLKRVTQRTSCPLFWFSRSNWRSRKGRRRPLIYVSCLVRADQTQSLNVNFMKGMGLHWTNAAKSSLVEGTCNRARRSAAQSTQIFLHDLPCKFLDESPWRSWLKTSLSVSQTFAPRSAFLWEILPRRCERGDARVLRGDRLIAERDTYMDC